MKLSILIASKDREQICKKLVHSINEQLTDSSLEYEILVLDDCSNKKYNFKEKNMHIIFVLIISLVTATINILFLVQDLKRWWNAMACGFCLGVGLVAIIAMIIL